MLHSSLGGSAAPPGDVKQVWFRRLNSNAERALTKMKPRSAFEPNVRGRGWNPFKEERDQREYHGNCHYRGRGESAAQCLATAQRENYVSFNLVHSGWVNRGRDREIGHAHPHDDFLDDCAWDNWIDHRRRGHAHVFAAGKRTIPSRRPHFFHTRRGPGSLYLLQIEDSFSSRLSVFVDYRLTRSRVTPMDPSTQGVKYGISKCFSIALSF